VRSTLTIPIAAIVLRSLILGSTIDNKNYLVFIVDCCLIVDIVGHLECEREATDSQ